MIENHLTLPKYRAVIFCGLALSLLYFISRHNYLLFHSLVDGISIVIAAFVFTIIWNARRQMDNDYFQKPFSRRDLAAKVREVLDQL